MSDNDRLDRIEADIAELYRRTNHSVSFEAETKVDLEYMKKGIDDLRKNIIDLTKEIRALSEKPAKRWDSLVTSAITTVIAFIIGYFGGKIK